MIDKFEMMELLVNACPSYQSRWRDYFASEYGNGEQRLVYIDIFDFNDHIVSLYKKNLTDEFNEVFRVIELLHNNGDDYVKEAATIGILEGIQNLSGNTGLDPEVFVKYLHPTSKIWWDKLNRFWSGDTKALRDDG